MYQGTTYDAMSSFNRTSKIGRHLLTSRISGAYKVVTTLVWVSLIGGAVLSYLTSIRLHQRHDIRYGLKLLLLRLLLLLPLVPRLDT